jgi:hypothetical protein
MSGDSPVENLNVPVGAPEAQPASGAENSAPEPEPEPEPAPKRDVAQLLTDNPEKSNRALARELGVNESAVRRARSIAAPGPDTAKRDIASLDSKGCKWPTGEHEGAWTFCGVQRLVVGNKLYPYCEKHQRLAYAKTR